MKIKKVTTGQYIFESQNDEGATDLFLEQTALLIGYIVHSFNSLEQLLTSTICTLLNERTDALGLIITEKLNYTAKVDLLERYVNGAQLDLKKQIPGFKELIGKLRESGQLRNAVVHADWETTDFDGYTFVKHRMGATGMEQEYRQFTPEALDKIDTLLHDTYILLDDVETLYYNLIR
jgi:hypothetical protein